MWKRVLPLSLLALGTALFLAAAAGADDKSKAGKAGKRAAGDKAALAANTYQGQIMSVDADKRQLMLKLMLSNAHGPGATDTKGTGTDTGGKRGTGEKGKGGTGDRGTGDGGAGGTGDTGTGGAGDRGTGGA